MYHVTINKLIVKSTDHASTNSFELVNRDMAGSTYKIIQMLSSPGWIKIYTKLLTSKYW